VSILSVAVVGLRGIAQGHARGFAALPEEYRLIAGCDLDAGRATEFADKFPGTRTFADYAVMLAETKPDVVVVATNSVTHAALAVQAAEAGVRGIFLEKPMAVSLGEARAVIAACRARGCALVVNHQRRAYPVFRAMRRLIAEGAIGRPELLRGSCAGDLLSDGTHTVDILRHLADDAEVKWVFGQVQRDSPDPAQPRGMGYDALGGWRYGHPIETGAMAVLAFETGLRAEIFTGRLQPPGRAYQDIEAVGDGGALWRPGDSAKVPLLVRDKAGGGWRPAEFPAEADPVQTSSTLENYRRFARMVREGGPHPLSGDSGFKDHEIIMAIYESARLHARIELPLSQDRFPLAIMLETGAFGK
jgi:predicted dehydrogenase